jgi:cell division protein FtsA
MVDEMTSPMFATGVGLLIKGLERTEKTYANMPIEQVQETPQPIKEEKITGHSDKDKKGTFFENLFKKAENWLADEEK